MAEEQNTTEELAKGQQIGKITHFFDKIDVVVLELEGKLKVGDTIIISGRGQEFEQHVDSMQADHEEITEAKKGDVVGLKIDQPAKEGDKVFLKG